ncbi:MAG: 50S ribosomal protein L1 [Candidatus Marinimicrobia bacterium]|nr:50S ribosomal protein L1 [Candidatus Neomarinimicrobiota bacterium]
MSKKSKIYKAQLTNFEHQKHYGIGEAIELLQSMPHVKFDETIDVAYKLGIDPRKSDQGVRGAIALPKGTGKKVTIVVIATVPQADEAKAAGADYVGFEDLIAKIKGGWLNFDSLIATPDAMKQVRPLGRVLGPRGLMPNPKTGTVTDQVGAAVKEAKAGRVEYRADKGACVHVLIGKLSFAKADLLENFAVIYKAILRAKPAVAKGHYMLSCTISSTMSPGVKLDLSELEREML